MAHIALADSDSEHEIPVPSRFRRMYRAAHAYSATSARFFASLSPLYQAAVVAGGVAATILGIAALIWHKQILSGLSHLGSAWRELRFGSLLMAILLFLVAFPPLIGYSTLSTLCGVIYGFPGGFPLLASMTVIGSFFSFLTFRYLLHSFAVKLLKRSTKFSALALTLQENTLLFLILIRLCPLPYSLSNGALAAIHTVHWQSFLAASIITAPKVFVHVFVGSRLADMGEEKSTAQTVVDALSIVIAGTAMAATTYLIYGRMTAKIAELAAERGLNLTKDGGIGVEDLADLAELEGFSEDFDEEEGNAREIGRETARERERE